MARKRREIRISPATGARCLQPHFTVGPCPECGTEFEVCGQPCYVFCPVCPQHVLWITWS